MNQLLERFEGARFSLHSELKKMPDATMRVCCWLEANYTDKDSNPTRDDVFCTAVLLRHMTVTLQEKMHAFLEIYNEKNNEQ